MTSKKKQNEGIWNKEAQRKFRKQQKKNNSNLHDGDPLLKTIILGDGAVGKTSLLIAYSTNEFPTEYVPTVADNHPRQHCYNDTNYQITSWDTAGQEDYDRLRPLAYPHTHVFIVAFSLISRHSFNNVKTKWIPEIKYHAEDIPFLIVGTKDDLREAQLWGNTDNINKLVHSYLRLYDYYNTQQIPLEILGMIEMYLVIQRESNYEYECISDKEAEEFCEEVGGDKYLFCSSWEHRGLNEIFDQVCISWLNLERKWGNNYGCVNCVVV
eukprot:476282_1